MSDARCPVFFDHDGGVDDYLATILLLTLDHVDLLGISILPADCFIRPAVAATRKILDLMGRSDIVVAEGVVRGVNPFPRVFRTDSYNVNALPILNESGEVRTRLTDQPGHIFMISKLRQAKEPVTLVMTGPLTHLATALDEAPDIEAKAKELIWMGGALEVPGNVLDPGHDGSAEWNAYWDPPAVHRVWRSAIPTTMIPLDVTNSVPVTEAFRRKLAAQRRYPISDLAGQCYALTAHQRYYFWDVLTVVWLARPQLIRVREVETAVIPDGPSQGRTIIQAGGKKIKAAWGVDKAGFEDFILAQWRR